jgi:hypothetical protein
LGQITTEIAVVCGAETRFKLMPNDAPSGLRRGLDRLGVANLVKGYADIEEKKPADEEEQPAPRILYVAHLPYADLRIDFNGKKAMVAAFGKVCVLMGVPDFLDGPLQPWREKLRLAAAGQGSVEAAIGARAIRDARDLTLAGTATIKAFRRLYPFGLSGEAMAEILRHMDQALRRQTQKMRGIAAGGIVALAAGLFAGVFLSALHEGVTGNWPWIGQLVFDLGLLGAALTGGWLLLGFVTRTALARAFPGAALAMTPKTGKIGMTMLGGIGLVFIAMLFLAADKPGWILRLLPG